MEYSKKFYSQLDDFRKSLISFNRVLRKDLSLLNADDKDTFENAQIHKFEICTEIIWKTLKLFIEESGVVVEASYPKEYIKKSFQLGLTDSVLIEGLMDMIDDRNKMSHIYNEDYFRDILEYLPKHFENMNQVLTIIESKIK